MIGFGGLVGVMALEAVWPRRELLSPRGPRLATNFALMSSNALVLSGLLGGALVSAYRSLELQRTGLLHVLGIGSWANVLLTVVLLDAVTYGWHVAYHRIPLMWRLHRVHHTDLELDVTSSGRFHLTEMALSALFRLGVIALAGADLASVVVFEIVFGIFNQLEHANLDIPEPYDRWLRSVVVTPAMHQVHHSQVKAETNSNFGTIFSCWDRLFGTYRVRQDRRALVVGLPEYPGAQDVTMEKVLALPFGPPCAAAETLARLAG